MISKNKLVSSTMLFTQEFPVRSWYYFLSTLGLSVLAFYGTFALSLTLGKLLAALMAGLLTCRLFVIYHDFQHDAILRKSVVAKFLMTIIGLLTLSPNTIWQETHQHHHTNNSKFSRVVMGSFPTITVESFRNYSAAEKRWYLMTRHPLMILFAYVPIFLVSFCLWPFFENPKKYYDCGLAVLLHGFIYWLMYLLGGWTAVVFSVFIPSVLTFAIGGYIFYAQHNFPMVLLREDDEWDYLDAALNSSSYIKMNRAMQWFTANIGYHHIHHVNSRIPFYRLPEAMDAVELLRQPRITSLTFSEVAKSLRLKLWDPTQQRLITLSEFYALNSRSGLDR